MVCVFLHQTDCANIFVWGLYRCDRFSYSHLPSRDDELFRNLATEVLVDKVYYFLSFSCFQSNTIYFTAVSSVLM